MYFNLRGKITHLFKNSLTIEVNNIGYQIYVSKVDTFLIDKETNIYTYLVKREDEEYLVGFKTLEEKEAFITLLKVKGVGPKTALLILGNCHINELYDAINNGNIFYLKRIPGIGNRCANQIVLDLKGTLRRFDNSKINDVTLALSNLGFKKIQIQEAINKINISNLTKEEILKQALQLLSK